jgi:prolyl-tRNA editing enzyme YbaK/EbsC (Cys-tRNA(Pro) deacylase)
MGDQMSSEIGGSAQRVMRALRSANLAGSVVVLPDSTHTAASAAAALGCEVAQIAKSIVLRAVASDRPVLVVTSGINRVDLRRVSALVGEPVEKASADFVRRRTGFAIGGVAPVGLAEPTLTFVDEDLFAHEVIWAAAGTPFSVFGMAPADAVRLTGGQAVRVK